MRAEGLATLVILGDYVVHGGPRWLAPVRLGLMMVGLAVAVPLALVLKVWEGRQGR